MTDSDQTFPEVLADLHQLDFDYDDGDGIDFEPYDEFMSADETVDWLRAWTGNDDIGATEYRVFGQDGTGGYAAFWIVREGKPLLEQPIVFYGSEGAVGVVASDFADYLWLLAGGIGPMEAVEYGADDSEPNEEFTAFAQKHAAQAKKSPADVIERARAEFPDFESSVRALCRH